MAKIRSSVGIKTFLACLAIGVCTWATGSITLYFSASRGMRNHLRADIMSIASTAATVVSPSLHESIHTRTDEKSRAYKIIKHRLASVRNANPGIRYIYTMRTTKDPNKWIFVVDAEDNPNYISHVGDPYDIRKCPDIKKALHHPSVDSKPTYDHWGTWLSGYAPIRNKRGKTIGIMGVDMSLNEAIAREAQMRKNVWLTLAAMLIISVLLSLVAAKVVGRRINVLVNATRRIESGDLDFKIEPCGEDEVGDFIAAFNHMILALNQSTRDFLTGLCNHRHFYEHLDCEIDRAQRYGRPVSLIEIDMDRFKSFNDTFGHQVGDSLLKQLGGLIRSSIRNIDIAARVGGDEFAIIAPETTKAQAQQMAERLRADIEKHLFYAVPSDKLTGDIDNSRQVHLTITAGIGTYPTDYNGRDGLVMAADIALCRGKHVSRNRTYAYDGSEGGDNHFEPEKLYAMLKEPNIATAESLAAAVDAKIRNKYGHSERVTNYALTIARAAGLAPEDMDSVKIAGLLHDLGKIGLPDNVVNKPGSLTQEEQEVIKQHPAVAGNILKKNPRLEQIIPAVIAHHERWDGLGYPSGLAGEQIPLMARILAIADAFDAMTTDRPYRRAMSVSAAILEIRANAGKQFDPALVEKFIGQVTPDIGHAA